MLSEIDLAASGSNSNNFLSWPICSRVLAIALSKSIIIAVALCTVVGLSYATESYGGTPAGIVLHGFSIDTHRASERQIADVLPSLLKQLEIVESVGVPDDVLNFFRTVPISVDPELTKMYGEYLNQDGVWKVRVKPAAIPSDRPVVLHEFLHAFHHQVLKQPTPAIGRAYTQALQANLYPSSFRSAHFLENGKEYFAVIGSIYLFGKRIDQPPYDCSIPRRAQPEFIAYLAEKLGSHDCK